MSGTDPQKVMQIHCPACGVRLSVPTIAAKRPARCPACHEVFRVPEPSQMLDETVVCWLDLDAIDDADDREDPDGADEKPLVQPEWSEADEAPAGDPADAPPGPRSVAPGRAGAATSRQPPTSPSSPDAASPARMQAASARSADKPPSSSTSPPSPTMPAPPQASKDGPDRRRPAGPRLEIVQIGAFGVRVDFPAHALDHLGFRASMPMRGIVSGEDDPTRLRARPLAWIDEATGHHVDPGVIETNYEARVRPRSTTREVVVAMTTIDELPQPFNQPMPYYVSHEDIGQISTVHCRTVSSPEGVRCEVTIPSMAYALEWLGRVNGVCGEDYAELELRVRRYESGAWLSIPAEVRHRLAVWFDFKGDERFLRYFNDADFAAKDAGLAGLLVTTRRLVYGKYHRHGSTPLDGGGSFALVPDGAFATLEHRAGQTRRPLIRLRSADANALAELLASNDVLLDREPATR